MSAEQAGAALIAVTLCKPNASPQRSPSGYSVAGLELRPAERVSSRDLGFQVVLGYSSRECALCETSSPTRIDLDQKMGTLGPGPGL